MATEPPHPKPTTQRIDGRLHQVQNVLDDSGNVVGTITKALKVEFRLEDLAQLVVGASVMALPASYAATAVDFVK